MKTKPAMLGLALLANCTLASHALATDITFTLDRENYSFGRDVPLTYPANCDGPFFDLTEVEDDGAGELAFRLVEGDPPPTVGCIPIEEGLLDLKWLFALDPGDYTLTVRQESGDQRFDFTVRDSVLDIGPAITGSWYDPAQNGQGLNIEVLPDRRILAYWYAYDDDGDNLWLLGNGTYDGDRAVFDVFQADGEGFPPNYDPASHELEPWGEMRLELDSCTAGTLSWTTTDEDFSDGEMPLQRLSAPNGQPCLDDEREADAWNSVNLLADDPELDFELLNATADGSGGDDAWTVAFEDLPAALGSGRALAARPPVSGSVEPFSLGTRVTGFDRSEFQDVGARAPFAVLAELTLALPGADLNCAQRATGGSWITFTGGRWDPASESAGRPLMEVGDDATATLPLGLIASPSEADCASVDEYLVRTYITPAVLAPFDVNHAVLTVQLTSLDDDLTVDGPVYLLDFRLRARESMP